MNFIIKIIISALAVLITAYMLPGVDVVNILDAIIVAAVLAFLNAIVKPLLVILTIPITILTLGIFLIVINALIILATDYLVDGFYVKSFWWAILFSVILSVITSVFEKLVKKEN